MKNDYDIKVLVDKENNLIQPIYIGAQKITHLGLYKVYGERWWVVKADEPMPTPEKEQCECRTLRDVLSHGCTHCSECGKPIKPTPLEPIQIEKLDLEKYIYSFPKEYNLANKINEIIDKLNGKNI